MENGNAVEPCVSNGERETSPHVLKQRNGIRPGFLNNHKTVVSEDAESHQEHEEVHPEYVPTFSQATPPSMVTADYTSITLQWGAVTQRGFLPAPPEGTDLPICSIAYSLQMQQVCVCVCVVQLLAASLLFWHVRQTKGIYRLQPGLLQKKAASLLECASQMPGLKCTRELVC